MRIAFDVDCRINLGTVIRWLLGLLFVWAGLSKLAYPIEFFDSIVAYELPLPDITLRLAAMALPWLELLCGLALLANVWTESALAVQLALFAFFILATGQAWLRGLDIACGCFDLGMIGISSESEAVQFIDSARFAFFRNIVLTALVAYLFMRKIRSEEMAQEPAPSAPSPQ